MSPRQFLICFFLLTSLLCFSCKKKPKVNQISKINTDSVLIQHEDTVYILNTLKRVRKFRNPIYYDSIRKTGFDMLNKSKQMNFTKGIAQSYYTLQRYHALSFNWDSAVYYNEKVFKYYESIRDTFFMARRLHAISDLYSVNSEIDKAINVVNKGRYYAECSGDTPLIYRCIHTQYFYQNQLQHSEKKESYLNEMAALVELSGNKTLEADFNNVQAGYYVDKANMKPAMDLYFKNIKLCEKIHDTLQLAGTYEGIANIYYILKDYRAAIEYYSLSEKIYLETERVHVNANRIFSKLGQCYITLEETGKAREYLRKSLDFGRKFKKSLYLVSTLQNLALSYYMNEDSLDMALNYLDESLELNHRIKNNEGKAKDLVLKGKIYHLKKDYKTAIQMAKSGLSMAEKYNHPTIILEGTNLLGLLYAELGQYQKAYRYQIRNSKLNDSLIAGEDHKKIARLEMQRRFDEKQKETELKHLHESLMMEAELKRNKLVRNFSIIAGLLFILLGVFIYSNFLRSRRSEKEKEILLKEIHHRVKNNLQIISSLLNLQSGTLSDDSTISAVIDSRSRVKSMALIHQLLYQSEMFTNINFASYLEQLMSSLHSTYCKPGENIRYKISAEPIKLDVDRAIPMGLIINELVTNAYKYAFQGKKEGNIEICLTKQPENDLLLSIADNGIGLPEKIDIQKTNSLGLRLVNLLVKQLKANINHERKNGTIIKIWIPSAA
jgi:two-component sensor histidine kinase